ncbi:hypothetical protein RFI_29257 [Reticulomyxa filosa]|uniref:Uncharacterized protein n=1 Tax=Reticulomyxa filosa TaxID=46433 RepID=X6M524_RETFI|nr:hypothetical protein RFI_29257 [Reticulomyxa filosa]|eukprot:ETO08135.1 hypothetical protein RFI_29257 [Reticulomyxa filosa]
MLIKQNQKQITTITKMNKTIAEEWSGRIHLIFLNEINTSVLKEVFCDHSLKGREFPANVVSINVNKYYIDDLDKEMGDIWLVARVRLATIYCTHYHQFMVEQIRLFGQTAIRKRIENFGNTQICLHWLHFCVSKILNVILSKKKFIWSSKNHINISNSSKHGTEQLCYVRKLEVSPGIALNLAFRENFFVILVALVTKTPTIVHLQHIRNTYQFEQTSQKIISSGASLYDSIMKDHDSSPFKFDFFGYRDFYSLCSYLNPPSKDRATNTMNINTTNTMNTMQTYKNANTHIDTSMNIHRNKKDTKMTATNT